MSVYQHPKPQKQPVPRIYLEVRRNVFRVSDDSCRTFSKYPPGLPRWHFRKCIDELRVPVWVRNSSYASVSDALPSTVFLSTGAF